MNQEIKEKWLSALRGGEYIQGKTILRTHDNKFCCLGVLCDIYSKEKGEKWVNMTNGYAIHSNSGVLPLEVMRWAGLGSDNPPIMSHSLANYNDFQDYDFNAIAELIEQHL